MSRSLVQQTRNLVRQTRNRRQQTAASMDKGPDPLPRYLRFERKQILNQDALYEEPGTFHCSLPPGVEIAIARSATTELMIEIHAEPGPRRTYWGELRCLTQANLESDCLFDVTPLETRDAIVAAIVKALAWFEEYDAMYMRVADHGFVSVLILDSDDLGRMQAALKAAGNSLSHEEDAPPAPDDLTRDRDYGGPAEMFGGEAKEATEQVEFTASQYRKAGEMMVLHDRIDRQYAATDYVTKRITRSTEGNDALLAEIRRAPGKYEGRRGIQGPTLPPSLLVYDTLAGWDKRSFRASLFDSMKSKKVKIAREVHVRGGEGASLDACVGYIDMRGLDLRRISYIDQYPRAHTIVHVDPLSCSFMPHVDALLQDLSVRIIVLFFKAEADFTVCDSTDKPHSVFRREFQALRVANLSSTTQVPMVCCCPYVPILTQMLYNGLFVATRPDHVPDMLERIIASYGQLAGGEEEDSATVESRFEMLSIGDEAGKDQGQPKAASEEQQQEEQHQGQHEEEQQQHEQQKQHERQEAIKMLESVIGPLPTDGPGSRQQSEQPKSTQSDPFQPTEADKKVYDMLANNLSDDFFRRR